MLKKITVALAAALSLLMLASCGGTEADKTEKTEKTDAGNVVHCDDCTTELAVDEDSSMTDEWIIYCESCSEARGDFDLEVEIPTLDIE